MQLALFKQWNTLSQTKIILAIVFIKRLGNTDFKTIHPGEERRDQSDEPWMCPMPVTSRASQSSLTEEVKAELPVQQASPVRCCCSIIIGLRPMNKQGGAVLYSVFAVGLKAEVGCGLDSLQPSDASR